MRSLVLVALLIVSSVAPFAAAAEGKEGDDGSGKDPDLANVPKGGVSPFAPPSAREASLGALAASALWLLVWATLAGVVGMVVVSSLTKPQPVAGDPLVTGPGTYAMPARAAPLAVAVPRRAAFESGRDLAYRASPETAEHAMRLMGALGLGEATLAQEDGRKVVRVANCSSCERRESRSRKRRAEATGEAGCAFEQGFLAGAFETILGREVRVTESRCAGRPGGACEFRVAT